MRHFRISFLVTFILMAVSGWWGYSHGGVPGMIQALWITGVLGVMEVSLSFDNAVVNASSAGTRSTCGNAAAMAQ